jgi:hypothetical protein
VDLVLVGLGGFFGAVGGGLATRETVEVVVHRLRE